MCKPILIRHSKYTTIIKINNASLSNQYQKLLNKKPQIPLEYILSTFINNFLALLHQKKYSTTYFFKNQILYFNFTQTTQNLSSQKNLTYPKKQNKSINSLITKLIINNSIQYKHDLLHIWKMCGVALPFNFFINLITNFKENAKFIENIGKYQGRSASKLQQELFGHKPGLKLAKKVISQSELLGGGKINILTEKPFTFNITNTYKKTFQNHLTENQIHQIDAYFNNLVRGAYEESMQINTQIIKTNDHIMLKTKQNFQEKKETQKNLQLMTNLKKIIN